MVTSTQCLKKYGPPAADNKHLTLYTLPGDLNIGVIPRRIFCNKDLVEPLTQALRTLVKTGHINELKTWDGCFNIRTKRGLSSLSLHSWAIAIDVNAFENGLGKIPKLSPGFVKCFTNAGFDWGGTWTRPDGMHFQLSKIT